MSLLTLALIVAATNTAPNNNGTTTHLILQNMSWCLIWFGCLSLLLNGVVLDDEDD